MYGVISAHSPVNLRRGSPSEASASRRTVLPVDPQMCAALGRNSKAKGTSLNMKKASKSQGSTDVECTSVLAAQAAASEMVPHSLADSKPHPVMNCLGL
ncbi:hypothetical protein N7516_006077 [Penicillium verrucosum]|uniref:uncharacterized protein n=1 Tax=Penicillium verrucosum TaxID=60171 RepID=UPI00254529F4|nr:uncharacterized protein N7516_006077 [Penicillium verrucosum]KAJ5931588.1 hypothetical protein N7516_006077 [Penicillium verrucosum]